MIVIELLTLRVWLIVCARLIAGRVRAQRCFAIDATPLAMRLARITGPLLGVEVETLGFRLIDIRDDAGLLIHVRIAYRDLAQVVDDVIAEPAFRAFLAQYSGIDRLASYAIKSVGTGDLLHLRHTALNTSSLGQALLVVQVARWKAQTEKAAEAPHLVLERRPWGRVIQAYAERHGVAVGYVRPAIALRQSVKKLLAPRGVSLLRTIRNAVKHRWVVAGQTGGQVRAPGWVLPSRPEPQLAVSYHGQFNLDDPSKFSDLFFWQQSALDAKDLLLLFEFPQDPLDEDKWRQLSRLGIGAIALYPGATTVPGVSLHMHVPGWRRRRFEVAGGPRARISIDTGSLKQIVAGYEMLREYWAGFFASQKAKVYVTWRRFDPHHIAIADALQEVGGVTAIYQRALQTDAGPVIRMSADIMFGYAPYDAEVERRSGSVIPYHVSVGYFGDHRFPLLREGAAALREALCSRGANYIFAFFDENSGSDSRWDTGHEFMRENYVFVLERLLADPSLGLVLKPKHPPNLIRRLGPVALLLERALASGRCHLYSEGALHGAYPPAAAALAADLAIHGHLQAASAGFEAALAGVPTLLLDREGWEVSDLYRLGEGRVAFRTWDTLWEAVLAHRARGVQAGLGDWSPMLEELDPFRDGRGAERMGTYLQWLLDGYKAGHTRDSVMAAAAERYATLWGADKVTSVNAVASPEAGRRMDTPTD